jgi:lysophospholipase L1-like esterase
MGKSDEEIPQQHTVVLDIGHYTTVLDESLGKIRTITAKHNIKTIIFYHPHFILTNDVNSITEETDYEYQKILEEACQNNDVLFVSMANAFIDEFNRNNILPHGFSNTATGAGHLNKNGHRIIANELYRQIIIAEKETIR